MKKKYLISIVILFILILIFFTFRSEKEMFQLIEVKAEKGTFDISVMVTGELQAESYTKIEAPSELKSRSLRISRIKIQDLVPEGTIVEEGDFVARLDRTEVDNKLKDFMEEVETTTADYENKKLDTTMQLRELRNELIDLKYSLEESKIAVEQSKYEPPAVIRQAQINLERSDREYNQAKSNYKLKERQAKAEVRQVEIELMKVRRRQQDMMNILNKFDILAPASGMVIYHKEWNGEKRKVGSEISAWEPVVATLPDMSSMISKTYVNEIDISKIKKGQKTIIGIDAFPDKKYEGEVIEIANIGEQLRNTDAKVFEVLIKLIETDSILKPAMTTSNNILIKSFEDVVYVPIEAIHHQDSISFVYLKNRHKREVVTGPNNENHIIIKSGLEKNEKILLSVPDSDNKTN